MKDGIQFINGYKPVETYRNGIKIAGSTPAMKTGTHLTFENTYDDYAHELIISGNTLEIGTGDKTPDNPYVLASVEGNVISGGGRNLFDQERWNYNADTMSQDYIIPLANSDFEVGGTYTISGDFSLADEVNIDMIDENGYAIGSTIYISSAQNFTIPEGTVKIYVSLFSWSLILTPDELIPIMINSGSTALTYEPYQTTSAVLPTLRKVGTVADEYDVVTGGFTKRLNEVTLTGTEAWHYNTSTSTSNYTTIMHSAAILGMLTNSQCICTHFPWSTGGSEGWVIGSLFNLRFANSRLGVTSENTQQERLNAAKAWLAAQHTAGTPVKVIYQLAEPAITYLDPYKLKTFYDYTQIYTDSEVPAELEAEVKIIGGS